MIGLGTLINVAGILLGGLGGLLFGKRVTPRFRDTLISAIGVCTLFLGIGGTLEEMMSVSDGKLAVGHTLMMIVCFALGGFLGELIDLHGRLERVGGWLKRKTGSERDSRFVEGFVSTSVTVCVGAMAILGSIDDGVRGDYSVLLAKTLLDFVLVMVMTVSLGRGCIFSAIPVLILQGSVTLLARLIEPILRGAALSNLSLTGSMLIFCVGVNLVWGQKIKVANLLPAILLAALWAYLPL